MDSDDRQDKSEHHLSSHDDAPAIGSRSATAHAANDKMIKTANISHRSRRSLPISSPPMPKVEVSAAQYGP